MSERPKISIEGIFCPLLASWALASGVTALIVLPGSDKWWSLGIGVWAVFGFFLGGSDVIRTLFKNPKTAAFWWLSALPVCLALVKLTSVVRG